MKFDWNICGHYRVTNFLQSAITNHKVAHAYLFVGPRGLGKQEVARNFLASILCQAESGSVPCNDCHHCRQLANGIHPDVYELNRLTDDKTGKFKSGIGVEQIRDLKSKLCQGTFLNSYRAVIIPEAQYINSSAANALLKALEEPFPKTVIILIAESQSDLPQTIASRCQVINFMNVKTVEIEKYLADNFGCDNVKNLARLSFGRPGRAISFLENEELLNGYQKDLDNLLKIAASGLSVRMELAEEVIEWKNDEVENKIQIRNLLNNWQSMVRDFILEKNDNQSLIANLNQAVQIGKISRESSFSQLLRFSRNIIKVRSMLGLNLNTKLLLENLIINF